MNRINRVAFAAGAVVSGFGDPSIRKGTQQFIHAVWGVVRNPPIEAVDPTSGEVAWSEELDRRTRWSVTRPRWTRTIGGWSLPCGCFRRPGLRDGWDGMAYFRWGCEEHFPRNEER